MARHLPVLNDERASSLRADGSRNFVHPADVHGRFTSLRYLIFAILIAILIGLPLLRIDGRPAIFLDVAQRRFFLFGSVFNAQDFWLVFFLLTGAAFALMVITTLWGRIFCGYACPQTVFLEGIYRRVERALEGPRNVRMRRNAGPMSANKVARKVVKHALFVLISLVIGHAFLSYFVSVPAMMTMIRSSPAEHLEAFGWVMGASALMYFNFAWFREQMCLIVCPYGRLQSALTDDDTVLIGYDVQRGEPRGKVKDENAGDCIDCRRCVVVCPTGIDIRNGLQIECIGCAACVDACDEVMEKVGRPKGLVRYDSLNGFAARARRILRPRVYLYAVLGVVGAAAAAFAFQTHTSFEAKLRRASGTPFAVTGDDVLNPLRLQLINKLDTPQRFELEPTLPEGAELVLTEPSIALDAHSSRYVSLVVRAPRSLVRQGLELRLDVVPTDDESARATVRMPIVGPGR